MLYPCPRQRRNPCPRSHPGRLWVRSSTCLGAQDSTSPMWYSMVWYGMVWYGAASQVAVFMENPAPVHWDAVCRIYRYLKGTRNVALKMASTDLHLQLVDNFVEGYSDADWAGCPTPARATPDGLCASGGHWWRGTRNVNQQSLSRLWRPSMWRRRHWRMKLYGGAGCART